jgi:hypothetical protein
MIDLRGSCSNGGGLSKVDELIDPLKDSLDAIVQMVEVLLICDAGKLPGLNL